MPEICPIVVYYIEYQTEDYLVYCGIIYYKQNILWLYRANMPIAHRPKPSPAKYYLVYTLTAPYYTPIIKA